MAFLPVLGYENEDIDRAIALSLAEENQIVRNKNKKCQLEEDEQIARAIQESLNFESPPRGGNVYAPIVLGNNLPYQPNPYYYSTGHRICAGCKREIGHGRFLSCLNAFCYPECFRCHGCGLPISNYVFSVSGNFPYHKTCYKERHYPKCDVCKHFIPTNSAGLAECRAHPFWMQKSPKSYCILVHILAHARMYAESRSYLDELVSVQEQQFRRPRCLVREMAWVYEEFRSGEVVF